MTKDDKAVSFDGNAIDSEFLELAYDITKRYEKIWGRWSIDSQLFHIVTEIAEVKDVLRNKENKYGKAGSKEYIDKLGDEVADVFLTAFATAGYLGMSAEQLNHYIKQKLTIVGKRVQESDQRAEAFAKEAIEKATRNKESSSQ